MSDSDDVMLEPNEVMPEADHVAGTAAVFRGIGVGPGDPELITLKAHRLISASPVVAYLVNECGQSMARTIAADCLGSQHMTDRIELPIIMPMARERTAANRQYDQAAEQISAHLGDGRDVAFLCEGDPFLFGSFAYLHERLATQFIVEVVPGVSSIQAAAAIAGVPLGVQRENLAVISGRHEDAQILDTLARCDNVVIMKVGSQRERLLSLIARSGRSEDACYIERAGLPGQRCMQDVRSLPKGSGPYFSLLLVNRRLRDRGEHALPGTAEQ